MSAAVQIHVPAAHLRRMSVAKDPGSPEFELARMHLSEGCARCSQRLEELRTIAGDPWTNPGDWIVPRRVVRETDLRSGVLADYQLVCGAGDYELDVIVRAHETPERLDIGGQVTRAMALHDPARDVPLCLLEARGDEIVGRTRTDEFGEFDFAAASGSRYGLRVGDRHDAPCVLVWEGAA